MGGFFHGWRRKLGVVTLVLACLLVGLWMRSHEIQDQFFSPVVSRAQITLVSADRQMRVSFDFDSSFPPAKAPDWRAMKLIPEMIYPPASFFLEQHWSWRWFGLDTMKEVTATGMIPVLVVSHWSIVLPLTLFSAWLLLSKPRKLSEKI